MYLLQNCDLENWSLTPCQLAQERLTELKYQSQIKQLFTLINCQCDAAKGAPNTNRHNFACNKLEYIKLKAFTLTLHVRKHKTTLCINYSFQNLPYILTWKLSEIDFLLIFEANSFLWFI